MTSATDILAAIEKMSRELKLLPKTTLVSGEGFSPTWFLKVEFEGETFICGHPEAWAQFPEESRQPKLMSGISMFSGTIIHKMGPLGSSLESDRIRFAIAEGLLQQAKSQPTPIMGEDA